MKGLAQVIYSYIRIFFIAMRVYFKSVSDRAEEDLQGTNFVYRFYYHSYLLVGAFVVAAALMYKLITLPPEEEEE